MTPKREKINLYGSVASLIGLVVAFGALWIGSMDARKALAINVLSKGYLLSAQLEEGLRLTYLGLQGRS